ncbi:MAG: helix-turn-helix domain-containing protein [Eggerthellaceae bacterium]|nr:helix-turn-helix domain-containing protein [Eggerthellaceae bacterium]
MSFTLNMVERELEPFGRVVRSLSGNPVFGEVRHYLNAATSDGPATLYVCDDEVDVLAASQAGCFAVYVNPDAAEPAEGAMLSVLEGESASLVFDALLDIARRFGEWEHDMDMVRLTGGSLQSLVDISEPYLQNNVVVLDPALKLLAYTKGVPCDDPITVELIEHGYHTEENISKFKLHKRFKSWSEDEGYVINDTHSICKYTTIVKSFKARSSFSLITVMMCNNNDDLDYLVDVFGMFTERVEHYALRDYPDDKPSGIVVDTFLKDLIGGTLNETAVAERCQYAGIPPTGRFCLFYMEPSENSVPSSRLLSDVSLAVAPAKTMLVDDAVTVLCFNCAHDKKTLHFAPETCPHAHRTNSERLNNMLERYDLTCGRSSKFTSLSKAPTAFAQAREAFAASKQRDMRARGLAVNAWSHIFSFDRYGMDYLTNQLPPEALELMNSTYAGTIIENIARQDAASHTNNYEFLYAYLVYERRNTVVAEKLHMHRNNVSYRIGRIEEQFGITTDDPQLRQDLLFAYRVREAVNAE